MRKLVAIAVTGALMIAACGGDTDSGDTADDSESLEDIPVETSETTDLADDTSVEDDTTTTTDPIGDTTTTNGYEVSPKTPEQILELATFADLQSDDDISAERAAAGDAATPPNTVACATLNGRDIAWVRVDQLLQLTDDDVIAFPIELPPGGINFDALVKAWAENTNDNTILTFDYVLMPAPIYGFGPGDLPSPAGVTPETAPIRSLGDSAGAGTLVVVADSGYPNPASRQFPADLPFLSNIGTAEPFETLPLVTTDPAVAHGLMVAGVVGQVAPGADVEVWNVAEQTTDTTRGWYITVSSLGLALDDKPVLPGKSVLNMSFGTYSCDFQPIDDSHFDDNRSLDDLTLEELSLMSLSGLDRVMHREADRFEHLVAAAGNNDVELPFYPAAFDSAFDRAPVIGVGAYDDTKPNDTVANAIQLAGSESGTCQNQPDETKAWFSNEGTSADMWAPGTDIVTAYPIQMGFEYRGTDVVEPGPLARISGTSFAAPICAAYYAAQLGRALP